MKERLIRAIKSVIPENVLRRIRALINNRKINKMAKMEKIPFSKDIYDKGVNLIGMFGPDSGLGQSCRLVAKEIMRTDIPVNIINHFNYSYLPQLNHDFEKYYSSDFSNGINIFHSNMQELFMTYFQLGKEKWDKHYNIAFWLWEMQEFPEEWVPMINQLDEIWTPAEFVSNAVRKVTDKPVYTIPYAVEAPSDKRYDREYFHLPKDKFLFLMLFDRKSITERKNPLGVIWAFKKAFSKGDDSVGLVVKIGNAREQEIEEVRTALEGYNVYFVEGMLDKVVVNSLIQCADVYVSLHRAEGFGLVLAEAMLLKTATIATNYSANTEFQSKDTSCLVDYKLIPVGKDIYPYKKEYLWADPDVDQAADYMKKLYDDENFRHTIVENAYKMMTNEEHILNPSKRIEERVRSIYESN